MLIFQSKVNILDSSIATGDITSIATGGVISVVTSAATGDVTNDAYLVVFLLQIYPSVLPYYLCNQ